MMPEFAMQNECREESIAELEARIDAIACLMDRESLERDLHDQATGSVETLPLPWNRLSEKTKALRPGCLVLVGGPTKTGKSFFMSNIAWRLFTDGYRWAYLPLEDSRKDFMWRMLAVMTNEYAMIDTEKTDVEIRRSAMKTNWDKLSEIGKYVSENPRHGHRNEKGETIIPAVPHTKVLAWAKETAAKARVVFIDPIAQIEFDGKKPWETEKVFVRHLLAIATDTKCTMVVAGHTVKRGGANAAITPTVEDFQGCAEWGRLAHTVLLLDGHESKTSSIFRSGGRTEDVEHNRTVIIGAARNGSGTRSKLAFNQSNQGPSFEEFGIIAPKKGNRQ